MSQLEPSSDEYRSPSPVVLTVRWSRAAARALEASSLKAFSLNSLANSETQAPSKRICNLAARRAVKATLQSTPFKFEALESARSSRPNAPFSLDLLFVDDARIHDLNREGRGKDRPTDVLSYPLWEISEDAEWGGFWPFEYAELEPQENESIALGDLVISVETAMRQASELRHDLSSEIAFLCIHGTLHLLGYDHDTASRRRTMWRLQDALFENWQRAWRSVRQTRQILASSPSC